MWYDRQNAFSKDKACGFTQKAVSKTVNNKLGKYMANF